MFLNGLKLFVADIIDVETGIQEIWYVVDETYDSALESFIEWANDMWNIYDYYFYEADDDTIKEFMEYHEDDIKVGIYDR
jgi:hypothetical protein